MTAPAVGMPYRCPRCLVRYPLDSYICNGGWQLYPPSLGPAREHGPTRVEPIPGLTAVMTPARPPMIRA